MSVPDGFVLLVEAKFKKGQSNPVEKTLVKLRGKGLMVEWTKIQTLEHFQGKLKSWFGLTTAHDGVSVNCNYGLGTSNLVAMANNAWWMNIISSYDHVYVVILSGRAEGENVKPGTPHTRYKLYLSQGPWPLVENTV